MMVLILEGVVDIHFALCKKLLKISPFIIEKDSMIYSCTHIPRKVCVAENG